MPFFSRGLIVFARRVHVAITPVDILRRDALPPPLRHCFLHDAAFAATRRCPPPGRFARALRDYFVTPPCHLPTYREDAVIAFDIADEYHIRTPMLLQANVERSEYAELFTRRCCRRESPPSICHGHNHRMPALP